MDRILFKLFLMEEARKFLKDVPSQAREKIYYNVRKVQGEIARAEEIRIKYFRAKNS